MAIVTEVASAAALAKFKTKNAYNSIIQDQSADTINKLDAVFRDLLASACEAVLEHVKSNAQVLPGIAVSTSGGAGATVAPGFIS